MKNEKIDDIESFYEFNYYNNANIFAFAFL